MARVIVSRSARSELRRFSGERFGKAVADRYLRGFKELNLLLGAHPLAGVAEAALGAGVRSFPYRRHRIYYRYMNDDVLILRVFHHARQVDPALFE